MKISSKIPTLAVIMLLALIALQTLHNQSSSEAHTVLDTRLRRHDPKGVGPIQRWRRPIRPRLRGQHRHPPLLNQRPLRRNSPGRSRSSPHPSPVTQAFLPLLPASDVGTAAVPDAYKHTRAILQP